ncbi:5-methyltetrahydropteroyltriglutamate--homocysteine methyltransferase [Anaerococcus tetradius]|uniref:5-methyltetrahydropteroyltriglutamate--homocysteine S-methyltransferase family protein n=1 Tax=Anaerococcus tetradius TaxID=33036 RepID=A0A133KGQ2_9FIRM|nr:5-methyltetrahydropteroyltriglutamate--homocysteine methyltransferase [Anaerococcus tetradius]KWZ78688.1 5-methyltetrahydropteroyltriglutamate--homocysteine S-methyltransferase family protein [Anaerococcus tetradius]
MSKRFLTVGSLLRNEDLLKYKREIEKREDITYPFYEDLEGYKKCEDEAVKDVVEKQLAHGLVQVTDGEYSKSLWHLDFLWGLDGVERFIKDSGYFFEDKDGCHKYETRRDIGIRLVGKLSGKNHEFINHFRRLKEIVAGRSEVKQCIPSPAHIYGELVNFGFVKDSRYYRSNEDFCTDLINAYKEFLDDFKAIGGEIIQFDDCLWEQFADEADNSQFDGESKEDLKDIKLAEKYIAINNEVIDYGHELGLLVYTHNCRGNYASRFFGAGTYDSIANLFLKNQHYDRFYLEWDDERAGSLKALEVFKDRDKVEIVLGLLSSKTNSLDDEERTLDLLNKASKIIDKNRLYLSHQCGFASCDCGNELSQEEEWAKIDQGQRLAEEFWGE